MKQVHDKQGRERWAPLAVRGHAIQPQEIYVLIHLPAVQDTSLGEAALTDGAPDIEEAVDGRVGEADAVGAVHAAAQMTPTQEGHRQAPQRTSCVAAARTA